MCWTAMLCASDNELTAYYPGQFERSFIFGELAHPVLAEEVSAASWCLPLWASAKLQYLLYITYRLLASNL